MLRTTVDKAPAKDPPEHRPPRIILLRELKVDSPVRRLSAETKLLALGGISVTLSYFPTWGAIGLVLALLLATALIARIPWGAWPRPPLWFWITLVIFGALASSAGGSPYIHIGETALGLGSLFSYLRFVLVGTLLLLAAAMLGWTTPLAEIAPAVSRLLAPLRLVRVPVDELGVAVALAVRGLPLLVGEIRTLVAVRRLRPTKPRPDLSLPERWLEELVDLLVAALAVSVRRAGELAEAISARGGTGLITADRRKFRWSDGLVLAFVACFCYAATLLPGS
jgi:energy-coupling factor transporter transmembrane protein EcfT